MATSQTRQDVCPGYVTFDELVREVVSHRVGASVVTYKKWLRLPLDKVLSMLLDHELVIEHEKGGNYMYSRDLVLYLIAYVSWHRKFGSRVRKVDCVRFLKDREQLMQYLPVRLHDKAKVIMSDNVVQLRPKGKLALSA